MLPFFVLIGTHAVHRHPIVEPGADLRLTADREQTPLPDLQRPQQPRAGRSQNCGPSSWLRGGLMEEDILAVRWE